MSGDREEEEPSPPYVENLLPPLGAFIHNEKERLLYYDTRVSFHLIRAYTSIAN